MHRAVMVKSGRATVGLIASVVCAVSLPGCGALSTFRTADPAVIYIAFGDSMTAGPSARDYPDILRELRNEPEDAFANEGQGGETANEGLPRLEDLLARDIFPNARVLIYWEGGNDLTNFIQGFDPLLLFSPDESDYPFTDEFEAELTAIQSDIESAVRLGVDSGLEVYVATYVPVTHEAEECGVMLFDVIIPGQAVNANVYVSMLNQRIRAAARNRGGRVLDVGDIGNTLLADPDNYFSCNHLSAQGNAIVADLFDRMITP